MLLGEPMKWYYRIWILLFSYFGLFPAQRVMGQYGLGFAGQEAVLDQRTGMDLSADEQLCFKGTVELSFEFSFIPDQEDYFGYVVRIIEGDQANIDLIYDRRDIAANHFKVVIGDKFSKIAFDIDSATLFDSWVPLTIKLDPNTGSLGLTNGTDTFSEPINWARQGCLKILFGYNNYRDFKTTDVPAMKVRNVKIRQNGKLTHRWPLDEAAGEEVHDLVQGVTASVSNPQWVRKLHQEWELLQVSRVGGQATAAFDPETESLYVVGVDSLLHYRVSRGRKTVLNYRSGPLYLANGSQSFYDTLRNQLLNICIDQHTVAVFDFETLSWNSNFMHPAHGTNYLHFNKFLSPADSNLYVLGGYGHFSFKNSIQRYVPDINVWQPVKPGGDFFIPRYLAALGATSNGAYILGGYGSTSGQQMLNPKNLYDLMFFDVASGTFTKRYEIDAGADDFIFANSLVIDEHANKYYGLVFPKQKYHSSLQLITGSLSEPAFSRLGNEIPFLFHDTRSFSDLFYCPGSKRFIAVTLYYDENEDLTTAKIYALNSPPLPYTASFAMERTGNGQRLLYFAFGILLIIGIYLFLRRAAGKRRRVFPQRNAGTETSERLQPASKPVPQRRTNAIFLFGGDLQLFDQTGTDITRSFTPLIKELFLVVLLHTIRWGRGISSEKLTEQFWFDKSADSARNNRSVNIAKINSVLEKLGCAKISKESGYWRLETGDEVYVDYQHYLTIVNNKDVPDKERIIELSAIVQRGGFLSETDYEWLDPFKAEVSIQVINTYMRFADTTAIPDDPEFMVELANNIFYFDPVHEEAMVIKCKALAYMGNHSLATQTFENFCNEYHHIYGEEFGKDYKTVLS